MRAPQIEIGKQSHLQFSARGKVFEIGTVRRNQQLRAEKSGPIAAKSPGYVGLRRFNPLQIHPVWQKNCEPGLGCDCFRVCFVNLDLDFARLHVHVGEPPLPNEDAQRIKGCRDAASVE